MEDRETQVVAALAVNVGDGVEVGDTVAELTAEGVVGGPAQEDLAGAALGCFVEGEGLLCCDNAFDSVFGVDFDADEFADVLLGRGSATCS